MKNILFVDAETDGLYGKFISIAGLVCDPEGHELESFYHMINIEHNVIISPWVMENVIPILGEGIVHETSEMLLEAFWKWYVELGDVDVIADVIYPVECRLFQSCVQQAVEGRWEKAPFPLLDLSSMLYAKRIDCNIERRKLIDVSSYRLHNALDDIRMSRDIWLKYIRNQEQ